MWLALPAAACASETFYRPSLLSVAYPRTCACPYGPSMVIVLTRVVACVLLRCAAGREYKYHASGFEQHRAALPARFGVRLRCMLLRPAIVGLEACGAPFYVRTFRSEFSLTFVACLSIGHSGIHLPLWYIRTSYVRALYGTHGRHGLRALYSPLYV